MERWQGTIAFGLACAFVVLVLSCGSLAGLAVYYHEGREEGRAAAAQWQAQAQQVAQQYQQLVGQIQAAQQRAQSAKP